MRRLIIVNTYYQLITAIQLRNTLFAEDELVLLISNQSNRAEQIAENLKNESIFSEVHFIRSKGLISGRSKPVKLLDGICVGLGLPSSFSFYLKGLSSLFFDEIVAYNFGVDVYSVYSQLCRYNPALTISVLEEGVLSYNIVKLGTPNWAHINQLRKMLGKKILSDVFRHFYCFYPSVYKGSLEVFPIPRIRLDSKTVQQIRAVFEIDKRELNYSRKYILFTTIFDFEGGEPIGEYELACRIADLVGKENLLIKQHPRDPRTIYTDNGFCVDGNSSIPWEAIQVSADFGSITYLTVNSGSVLSGSTLSETPIRTFFLYPLCDCCRNEKCQKTVKDLEAVLSNDEMKAILQSVHVAQKLEDII